MKEELTIDQITYRINGCAMKVHNTLGNGFQEVIYQRCLAIELERAGLDFVREKEHAIFYENINVGTRRADFVVEDKVIVELKALINLEDVHLAQAKNYVVAYDFAIGLLINFGAVSLQFKKVFNKKYKTAGSETTGLKDNQDLNRDQNPENPENPENPDSDN